MSRGWTGVSFPFRLSSKGGITMSNTTIHNPQHVEESIVQILNTRIGERNMELYIGSELDFRIFDPNDIGTHGILKYDIMKALNEQEPRIHNITEDDIVFSCTDNTICVTVNYTIKNYGTTQDITIQLN